MKYTVYCGDAQQLFVFGAVWTDIELLEQFNKLFQQVEVAPGLVLQDENGKQWKPKMVFKLEPVT